MRVRCRLRAGLVTLAVIAALAVQTLAGTTSARAQSAENPPPTSTTLLVFDGSGSMWGKLDGEKATKLVQAREAIKVALGKANPQRANVGLMSFGHRRAADCSDVQLITPPDAAVAPAFVDRIMSPLDKLNPKGKGPLAAALKEAAKQLGKTSAGGPRSIVLIHDDPDNCQQDACAALAEMQAAAPGVIVHVVGLGLKPEDASRYQCLTVPTGGRQIDAQTGDAMVTGLGEVLAIAVQGSRVEDATTPVPARAAEQAQQPAAAVAEKPKPLALAVDGPPAFRLRALLAPDVPVRVHQVRWTAWADPRTEGAPPAASAEGADAVMPLPAGTYRVRAEAGVVATEQTATLGTKGEALVSAVFDAGEIRLRAPLAADATVLVSRRTAPGSVIGTAAGQARIIGIWPHRQIALLVPAGSVALQLEQAELRADIAVDVIAGKSYDVDAAQPGGRILLDLLPPVGPTPVSNGAAPPLTVYVVAEDDPDAAKGRREIARSAAPTAEFVVSPGNYIVSAVRGGLEARERVTVAAGQAVHRSLPLVAARLVVSARLGRIADTPADPQAGGQASDTFRLVRLDNPDAQVMLLQGPAAIADVPPGRYRVEARRNAAAISAHQEVEIKAGDYKAVTLEYQAGGLRLQPALSGEQAAQAISWRVLDADGRLVWTSSEPAPSVSLAVGRYVVRMATRSVRHEAQVEIRNGDVLLLRLGQP